MPIIESVKDQNSPLCQGDILKGVQRFSTKNAWLDGGEADKEESSLCLVMSRPCAALRRERIVVASIVSYKNSPPSDFESFEEYMEFFVDVRDGVATPDLFYLGQIEGYDGSLCARFDLLHPIYLPKFGSPERASFIATSRIATLNPEFARDLHLRMFRAFASLGFDDHSWYATEDLRTLVTLADRDEANKSGELKNIQAKLQIGKNQKSIHQKAETSLKKQEVNLKKELEELKRRSQPFRDELARREPPSGADDIPIVQDESSTVDD